MTMARSRGWVTYFGIRTGIAMHRLVQMARPGVREQAQGGTLSYRPWSELLHQPALWITLFTAIAIGLWLVRARTHTA